MASRSTPVSLTRAGERELARLRGDDEDWDDEDDEETERGTAVGGVVLTALLGVAYLP